VSFDASTLQEKIDKCISKYTYAYVNSCMLKGEDSIHQDGLYKDMIFELSDILQEERNRLIEK
jgi:hypothetical protein